MEWETVAPRVSVSCLAQHSNNKALNDAAVNCIKLKLHNISISFYKCLAFWLLDGFLLLAPPPPLSPNPAVSNTLTGCHCKWKDGSLFLFWGGCDVLFLGASLDPIFGPRSCSEEEKRLTHGGSRHSMTCICHTATQTSWLRSTGRMCSGRLFLIVLNPERTITDVFLTWAESKFVSLFLSL